MLRHLWMLQNSAPQKLPACLSTHRTFALQLQAPTFTLQLAENFHNSKESKAEIPITGAGQVHCMDQISGLLYEKHWSSTYA